MKIFLILFFFMTSVFALERKAVAEYIVSGPKLTVKNLEMTFKIYPPDDIKALSKGNYLLIYKKDPGLFSLEKAGGKTLKVQPNSIYKSLK